MLLDVTELGVPPAVTIAPEAMTTSLPLTELDESVCELREARDDAPKRDRLGPGVDGSLSIVPAAKAESSREALENHIPTAIKRRSRCKG